MLNPTCHLLVLLAHPILHISRIRVNTVGLNKVGRKMSSCVLWMEGMRASQTRIFSGSYPDHSAQHICTQIMHENLC
jgi:hypothetical protein